MNYVPGLDGLRAVAVIAVVLFHAEFDVVAGGFLGVSLFFTLSGFLITTLLLAEYDEAGTVSLRRFYARRARRLLPAAFVCLALVVAASAWWTAGQQRGLPGDVLAALANVANWRYAFSPSSYEELFLGEASPVAHFWSLAIEEQIYLVLPLLVLFALRRGTGAFAALTAGLLAFSVAATLLATDRDLIYNGTHTRAAELLVGVGLAQVLHHRTRAVVGGRGRAGGGLVDAVPGALAATAFLALVSMASLEQQWIYDGGLVGVALVSAVLITAVVDGRFPAQVLATAPLVAIGKVSYGIYLFHWPVFLLLDEQRTGLDRLPLLIVRCAATAGLTLASYRLIEQPIRTGTNEVRHRATVPVLASSAVALAVAAVVFVPAPALTETEQLLVLGEQEIVDFAAIVPVENGAAATDATIPRKVGPDPGPTTATVSPRLSAQPSPSTTNPDRPHRIAVLGSDPAAHTAFLGGAAEGEFDVVEDIRADCPLSSADTPGCPSLAERWESLAERTPADVLVLASGDAEDLDALDKRVEAVTGGELIALGAADEAAISSILATIGAAQADGVEVVWYTSSDPEAAFFRHFARVGVEAPEVTTVVGTTVAVVDAVRDVAAERADSQRRRSAAATAVSAPMRVLVIGDSTSLNFARALHDGGADRLEVLWAGANGCPFARVEGIRGLSTANWTLAQCPQWDIKVPPLLESFDPDVLFVMNGPTELQEHRFPGDPTGWNATDAAFRSAREAQLAALLSAAGPEIPVLIADLPAIAEGRFSGAEMTAPDRLAAINEQIVDWDDQYVQVARFPYRVVLEAAEAERDVPIRSDGTHPDVGPLTELARSVYVDDLLLLVDAVRGQLTPSFGFDTSARVDSRAPWRPES